MELELEETNKFGHSDGYARLGAGLTWGTSKFGYPGVLQLARDSVNPSLDDLFYHLISFLLISVQLFLYF